MMNDLRIEEYNPIIHTKHIYEWMKLRNMDLKLIDELPKIGVISIYKDLGICAAFLRKVESNYGLIDSLITNPEALSHLRNEAIDECVSNIIKKAKELKLRQLFAYSIDFGIIERSLKHGFLKLPHLVIGLDLN